MLSLSELVPLSPAQLDIRPRDSVDISCNDIQSPMTRRKEREKERESRYESALRCFNFFNFFFLFLFSAFFGGFMRMGYMWVVRLGLTFVRL